MNKWISVKEKLPEFYTQVLIYRTYKNVSTNKIEGIIEISTLVEVGKSFYHWSKYNIDDKSITHWMPLPENPK